MGKSENSKLCLEVQLQLLYTKKAMLLFVDMHIANSIGNFFSFINFVGGLRYEKAIGSPMV